MSSAFWWFRIAIVVAAGFVGFGDKALAGAANAAYATVGEETAIPYGWVDFCQRQPQECEQDALPAENLTLTPRIRRLLRDVNRRVNASIEPVTNLDHWGTMLDHWDYPTDGKGDCKIFALEKRRVLMAAGLPRQALLMTIVRDHAGMGQAILTVRTDRGDLILDNLKDEILPWTATGYRFVKRQSQEDPNVWLVIEPASETASLGAR